MYRARDRVENEAWLDDLQAAADRLDLDATARSIAEDLFLSSLPKADRSKPVWIAVSLYVGALIAGEERSQGAVADATGVSRLSIQNNWKPVMQTAGFDPPTW